MVEKPSEITSSNALTVIKGETKKPHKCQNVSINFDIQVCIFLHVNGMLLALLGLRLNGE